MIFENAKHFMRQPCKCGCSDGVITTKAGQDMVYCSACGKWQYNAPKSETGRDPRTACRDDLPASQKARIRERDGNRCVICGASASESTLHISHIVSVKDMERLKAAVDSILKESVTSQAEAEKASNCIGLLLRHYVSTDGNLFVSCEACNLGQGGKGYWNMIRKHFPDHFLRMAKLEREIGRSCISGRFLDELREDEGSHKEPDISCGLFCLAAKGEI